MPEKTKILVVDDDAIQCENLKMILDGTGEWLTFTASSSQEALKSFQENDVDIVLLDLILKGDKNGVGIFQEMKSIKPEIKVILFTGYGLQEEKGLIHDAISEGMLDEILRKPIWPGELLKAIEKYKNN